MGMVTINIQGSFTKTGCVQYSATEGGHVQCLQRAINYLVGEIPRAIQLDHQLHDMNRRPGEADFGEG